MLTKLRTNKDIGNIKFLYGMEQLELVPHSLIRAQLSGNSNGKATRQFDFLTIERVTTGDTTMDHNARDHN